MEDKYRKIQFRHGMSLWKKREKEWPAGFGHIVMFFSTFSTSFTKDSYSRNVNATLIHTMHQRQCKHIKGERK